MEVKTDKLEVIAKTGGIKLAGNKEQWINPCKESKDKILENIEKIKQWKGKSVVVEMVDENTYSGIGICEDQDQEDDQDGSESKGTELLQSKHIINLQGKEFVTHAGLLEVAHKIGLQSIETNMISSMEEKIHLFKAKVTLKNDRFFEAYGDASAENTNSMIAKHIIRMAETRAVNRALRFATNIGLCSIDELGGEDGKDDHKPEFTDASKQARQPENANKGEKTNTPKAKDQKDSEPAVVEEKIQ